MTEPSTVAPSTTRSEEIWREELNSLGPLPRAHHWSWAPSTRLMVIHLCL